MIGQRRPSAPLFASPAAYRRQQTRKRAITTLATAPQPRIINKSADSTSLHASRTHLFLAIAVEPPGSVKLTRVTDHPTNQEFNATWTLRPAASTRVALELDAKLRVPWYIRAGRIGDAIAEAFVSAACRRLATPSQ